MTSRKSRAAIAKQTLAIIDQGWYEMGSQRIDIAPTLENARSGTRLYSPDDLSSLVSEDRPVGTYQTRFRVENATSLAIAHHLVTVEEIDHPMLLNFASAKNPGGGFLSGSQAQEESIARSSGLFRCIEPVRGYYDFNRSCGSSLYSHHMIYSPDVPVFRNDAGDLLENPYSVSILTAPAVNAGAVRDNEPDNIPLIEQTMKERIEMLLAVALQHDHKTLILGAWGCGVFRNEPGQVADWFHHCLVTDPRYNRSFERIFFAILDDTPDQKILAPFRTRFELSQTMGL